MSRTAFAPRFKAATSDSPSQYLTRWRRCFAICLLRECLKCMTAIRASIGYENCISLQCVFKRVMQAPLGEYGRRQTGNAACARLPGGSDTDVETIHVEQEK